MSFVTDFHLKKLHLCSILSHLDGQNAYLAMKFTLSSKNKLRKASKTRFISIFTTKTFTKKVPLHWTFAKNQYKNKSVVVKLSCDIVKFILNINRWLFRLHLPICIRWAYLDRSSVATHTLNLKRNPQLNRIYEPTYINFIIKKTRKR